MDKKAKKKIDTIRQRLTKLKQQLSGAKQQMDDADEVRRLQQQVDEAEAELVKWQNE